ncbi:hypothetical protein N7491_010663 [Penicillium cf. griseofulvum]|nr:hypothetical protein N7491_010663 [Penicillium cf. griseofulvum]
MSTSFLPGPLLKVALSLQFSPPKFSKFPLSFNVVGHVLSEQAGVFLGRTADSVDPLLLDPWGSLPAEIHIPHVPSDCSSGRELAKTVQ